MIVVPSQKWENRSKTFTLLFMNRYELPCTNDEVRLLVNFCLSSGLGYYSMLKKVPKVDTLNDPKTTLSQRWIHSPKT